MKSKLIYIYIFLVGLFIVSGFFFTEGMIGHRMDWSIPIYNDSLKEFLIGNLYKWRLQNLGYQKVFYTNFEFLESLVGAFGYLPVGTRFVPILLIFISISFSGMGFIFFGRQLNKFFLKEKLNDFSLYIGGFFYATSYAMFNQMLGGNWGIIISAAFFPFFVSYLIRYIFLGSISDLIISTFFLVPSIAQVHYIFYIAFIIPTFLIFSGFKKTYLYRVIHFGFLSILLNMFWIIDFMSILQNQSDAITSKVNNTSVLWALRHGNNFLMNAIGMNGWGNNQLEKTLSPFFWLGSVFLLMVGLMSFFLYKEKKVKLFLSGSLVCILFFTFIFTGFREPFISIKSIIFSLPGSSFFKSPQHALLIISFFFALIISFGTLKIVKSHGMRLLFVFISISVSYNFLPWLFINNFNYYNQSPIIIKGTEMLEKDARSYRVMFLPSAIAPYIPENRFIPKVGADIDSLLFTKTSFHTEDAEDNNIRRITEKKIYDGTFTQNDLWELNIEYIFLRNDRMHGNTDYGVRYWNWENKEETYKKLFNILSNSEFLVLEKDFSENGFLYSIWRVPHLNSLISGKNISFKRTNPTRFDIRGTFHAKSILSFLESFNPEWKLYLEPYSDLNCIPVASYSGSITECASQRTFYAGGEISKLWQKPIFDDTHKMVYDYANEWTIDPAYIKANYPKEYYKENPDGSIDVRMTLYFRPQSYFYIGLIISGLTFVGLLGYLGYAWIRERRRKSSIVGEFEV